MNQNEAIVSLKKVVESDKAASAVFHVFALRKRARHMVTILGLMQRMKAEGFEYSRGQYEAILKIMAEHGFGKLEKDPKGQVTALKDIKTTLQSLGKAVLSQDEKLKGFKQRNRFNDLVATAEAIRTNPEAIAVRPFRVSGTVSITLSINGKPIIIPVPSDLTPEETAGLINRLQDNKASK